MTTRAVAAAMLAAAGYVLAQAGWSLTTGTHPRQSTLGIALLAGSVMVLPVLGRIKLRLARQLHSLALRGDGILSAPGAVLAAAALITSTAARHAGRLRCSPDTTPKPTTGDGRRPPPRDPANNRLDGYRLL